MNVNIISTDDDEFEVSVDGVCGNSISNGVRFVYRVGEYVIKFPNPEYGISYTHDELAVWNRISEEDRQYFVPIIEQTDNYVVQPYVELSNHTADTKDAKNLLRRLEDTYNLNDLHPNNWDTTPDGKLIIFDYALGEGSYGEHESYYANCEECGTGITQDDARFDKNDNCLCSNCYLERWFYCDKCDTEHEADNRITIEDHPKYSQVCEDCAKELGAVQCEDCENWHVDDYVIVDDSDSVYCNICAKDRGIFHCDDCGQNYEYAQVCEPCGTNLTPNGLPKLVQTEQTITVKWNGLDQTFENIRVWKLECAKGLFIYHAKQIDTDQNYFHVVHEASGLSACNGLTNFNLAIQYASKIGSLIDWTQDKETTIKAIERITPQIFKIRQELGIKGR